MTRTTTSRATVLVTLTLLTGLLAGPPGAQAMHGTDTAGWIEQLGDGQGNTKQVISDFHVNGIVYDPGRFQRPFAPERADYQQYLAFGTVVQTPPTGAVFSQLAMSKGNGNGTAWGAPIPAVIKDPSSDADVPFVLNDADKGNLFDVVYTGSSAVTGSSDELGFVIIYRVKNGDPFRLTEPPSVASPAQATLDSIHSAVSRDGVHWSMSQPIRQPVAGGMNPVITGATTTGFKRGSYGPTDLIFQPGTAAQLPCAVGGIFPWNCPFVMVYSAIGDGGTESLGIAGSIGFTVGTAGEIIMTFRGNPAALLPAGPGWDSGVVTAGHIRKKSATNYQLYYAGGDVISQPACAKDCSIGVATSSNGLAFTKAASNPATPKSLFDLFFPLQPGATSTLTNPRVIDDTNSLVSGHARAFVTRFVSTGMRSDAFLGATAPAPGPGPTIQMLSPVGGYFGRVGPPVEIYMTDTLGTLVGVDLSTLVLTLDGAALTQFILTPSIVTALKRMAHKLTVPEDFAPLTDGLHTLTISVKDYDGNLSTVTRSFTIDKTPPVSTILTAETERLRAHSSGLGTVTGETIEGNGNPLTPPGTGIRTGSVYVTNPRFEVRRYPIHDSLITKINSERWTWTWIGPSANPYQPSTTNLASLVPDTFYLLPGAYSVSVRFDDLVANLEGETAANTRVVMNELL